MLVRRWRWFAAVALVLGACQSKENESPNANATTCASQGLTDCGGYCANLTSDAANCGACGQSCNGQFCNNGVCQVACDPGLVACGQSCSNLLVDSLHCGDCSIACSRWRIPLLISPSASAR